MVSYITGSGAWILGGDKQPALVTITEDGSEGPAAVLLGSDSAQSIHPTIEVQRTSWSQFSKSASSLSIFPSTGYSLGDVVNNLHSSLPVCLQAWVWR